VPHDNKVVWICHQLRQVYDLWRKPEGFGTEPAHLALRRQVRALDRHRLGQAQRYAISDVTRERLERFTGLDATVLYPPLPTEQGYDCAGYGEFVFCPGRFVYLKRQELLIRALAQTRTPVRLHLAGAVEDAREIERLDGLAASLGVTGRLTLESAFIPEARKKQLLADALAVAYVPIDEDYGYVPLEAIASRKAVITATDSGGALTAVRHMRNGLVVEPSPEAVAEAMDRLYEDRSLAERLGHAGTEVLASLGISWAAVVDALTREVNPRADFP
jgi:glycosyltransferase involved in cell wall biosynthesis